MLAEGHGAMSTCHCQETHRKMLVILDTCIAAHPVCGTSYCLYRVSSSVCFASLVRQPQGYFLRAGMKGACKTGTMLSDLTA